MRSSLIVDGAEGSLGIGADGGLAARRASRFVKGTAIEKPPNNDGEGLVPIIFHPLNILLVCFPFGIVSWKAGWNVLLTFWLNFIAMIPLAKILGDATEELAAGLKNDMLAGLLNATFGNVVEMLFMVIALKSGKMKLVKETLLGSVLSNLLLVLGMSFFCGGLVQNSKKRATSKSADAPTRMISNPENEIAGRENSDSIGQEVGLHEETYEFAGEVVQTFSVMTALVNTSMLLLSCLSTCLVTVFSSELKRRTDLNDLNILVPVSRICSLIIIMAYIAYVFFQLVTHREAMAEGDGDDEAEEDSPSMSIRSSVALMAVTTIVVAASSEALVDSVDGVVEGECHLPENFIGIILMPIIGNACEHASAIRFAIQDKPGLSIGIAVGSSTQISLFVVPFSVLCGWWINQPMDLNFGALNTTVMIISVVVVLSVVVDGCATWLQGYLLVSAYIIVAVLYWHLPNNALDAELSDMLTTT